MRWKQNTIRTRRIAMKKLLLVVTISITLLAACGAPVADQPSAAQKDLPVTSEPTCGTVVTMVDGNPPMKFGETKIGIEFINFYYDGIVAGGGFVTPANGGIDGVLIGGKNVTLTRNDFSEGSIHTQEFGKIEVLFTANVLQGCALLVATPEQVTQISDWIRWVWIGWANHATRWGRGEIPGIDPDTRDPVLVW
jgi:hypothetical protein